MPEANVPVLHVEVGDGRVDVLRVGFATPVLTQHAHKDHRPFIHPILIPDGTAVLTQDAPGHHPWQHGLYIGLNDVNGVGFWSEGLHPRRDPADDGTFHPQILGTPRSEGNRAEWSVRTEYRSHPGDAVLEELQEWAFTDFGDRYTLDLRWTITAVVPITFGKYEYGGLFLRMPYSDKDGGTARNSERQVGEAAEGQRARWVSSQMPLDGAADEVLVVVMDRPGNLEYPTPWRVDNELGIGPSPSVAGPWQLAAGASRDFHYRVAVFARPVGDTTIEQAWTSFVTGGLA